MKKLKAKDIELEDLYAFARNDLATMVEVAFRELHPELKLKLNWHIDVLCHALEEAVAGNCKRLIINLPPRMLKSFICSVVLPAWHLGRTPQSKIMVASYGDELAEKFSLDCRKFMSTEVYGRIFPNLKVGATKNSVSMFDTSDGGYRMAVTVGSGAMLGFGADILIIDDPETPTDMEYESKRKSTKEWFGNTAQTRLNDTANGIIIVVTQRLHEDDFTSYLNEMGGWTRITLPALAERDCSFDLQGGQKHLFKAGALLHPEHLPLQVLAERKHAMGNAAYLAQYQQSPVPGGGGVIPWSAFSTYDKAPPLESFSYVIQSWDPAISVADTADYSACTTWGFIGDKIYLLDAFRMRYGFGDLERKIRTFAEQWRVHMVVVEKTGLGMTVFSNLREKNFSPLAGVSPRKSKEARLEQIAPLIESGRVLVPKDALWLDDFKKEIQAFPKGAHDDLVDSMTLCLTNINGIVRECVYQAPMVKWPHAARLETDGKLVTKVYGYNGGGCRDRYAERMSDW